MSVQDAGNMLGASLAGLEHKWGWVVALGVFFLLAGFIALTDEFAATVVSVFVTGVSLIVAGIVEVITGHTDSSLAPRAGVGSRSASACRRRNV